MGYTAISAFVVDQIFGFQTANNIRGNVLAALGARSHADLGGNNVAGILSAATFVDVESRVPVWLDGTETGGLVRQARIQYRTSNRDTEVDWRIRNITDATDLAVGSAYSTDEAIQEEIVAVTPAAGEKEYRLQITGDAADNPVFGWGHIEQYI